MKKQWKLDNKGMTLLEVIVAFAIFAIAATILITGFNGALRVMGNSEAIKDASQENTGKLNAVGASALEEFEGLQNSEITNESVNLNFTSKYMMPGKIYTATSKEKTDMDMKMFQPDGSKLEPVKLVAIPKKAEDKNDKEGTKSWESGTQYYQYIEGQADTPSRVKHDGYYFECIKTHIGAENVKPNIEGGQDHWVRINNPEDKDEWMEWITVNNGHLGYGYLTRVKHKNAYWISLKPLLLAEPGGTAVYDWARMNGPGETELNWVDYQTYYTGAIVRYNGKLYQNNGAPTLYAPGTTGIDWVEVKAQ